MTGVTPGWVDRRESLDHREQVLSERIRFSAPGPLARITVTEGVAAHRAMPAGIAAHFS